MTERKTFDQLRQARIQADIAVAQEKAEREAREARETAEQEAGRIRFEQNAREVDGMVREALRHLADALGLQDREVRTERAERGLIGSRKVVETRGSLEILSPHEGEWQLKFEEKPKVTIELDREGEHFEISRWGMYRHRGCADDMVSRPSPHFGAQLAKVTKNIGREELEDGLIDTFWPREEFLVT